MKITNWGIVGTGTMAGLFVESLARLPGAKIKAVASRSSEGAKSFAAKYGVPSVFDTVDQLVSTAEVDVVYISTPNENHHQHSLLALNSGRAVLCEKPFALCASQASEVVALARKRGLFCMEAMWMRFSPAVREVIADVREGKLGKVHFFSGQLGFPYTKSEKERVFLPPGGGALLDLGVYPISLAQAILGEASEVLGTGRIEQTGVDEQFSAIFNYPTGAQAQISASLRAELTNSASIHGDLGVVHLEGPLYYPESYRVHRTTAHSTKRRTSTPSALRQFPAVKALAKWKRNRDVKRINRSANPGGYYLEAAEVQRCLQQGELESPIMPLADTIETLKMMDRIRDQWTVKLS